MRFAAIALVLIVTPAAAQVTPIPPSVLRSDVDAARMIRPPPEPRAVMREPPGNSAVAEELARTGVSAPPRPIVLPPPVDLRRAPLSVEAIVEALRPE
jgi:hypothetical protein